MRFKNPLKVSISTGRIVFKLEEYKIASEEQKIGTEERKIASEEYMIGTEEQKIGSEDSKMTVRNPNRR